MTWVLLIAITLLPALLFGFAFSLFPGEEDAPRWRVHLARRLRSWADRLHRPPPEVHDPFAALWVQERLGTVAGHVRRLEADTHCFARAERIIATQLAYDDLLRTACGLAGVEIQQAALGDPAERFRREVELTSRGWSW
ncbi:hypothetical protein KIN34_03685 [Cellulomonas sp. DKR-3]|uniref:Uncharacterized protein n=1 Tax=Cellulomonas fulva TaxID=2835530 RepID=A0ABS5TW70_9CELL|nr:type IV pilin N-terminal domain-containing protein [Cellulomonas fulva]MBT0993386.1 hypothetical protein [Cellulomonas fulva]